VSGAPSQLGLGCRRILQTPIQGIAAWAAQEQSWGSPCSTAICTNFSSMPAHHAWAQAQQPTHPQTRPPLTRMGCSFMARPMLPLILSLRIKKACISRLDMKTEGVTQTNNEGLKSGWHAVAARASAGSRWQPGLSRVGAPALRHAPHLLRAQLPHDHLHKVVAWGAARGMLCEAQRIDADGSTAPVIVTCVRAREVRQPPAPLQPRRAAALASSQVSRQSKASTTLSGPSPPRLTADCESNIGLIAVCWRPLGQAALCGRAWAKHA